MAVKKVLITGTAGFIGYHLAEMLIKQQYNVVGLDAINNYYSLDLKYDRLANHGIDKSKIAYGKMQASTLFPNYQFIQLNLEDHDAVVALFQEAQFDYVVHLAAQAGVRYSLENPRAYTRSNVDGFLSILEGARHSNLAHLVYASTSSIYGLTTKMPLNETTPTEHPMTLYAATKKANEAFAHSYAHLYGIPTTGLRFFTVYGPWGRPDMALFLFTEAMLKNKPINVFNHGKMIRDFTYVADIVESISRLLPKPAVSNSLWQGDQPESCTSSAPYQIFNIGNSSPVPLMEYIEAIENALGIEAIKNFMPMQPGDVPATHADVNRLVNYTQFKPQTSVKEGVTQFVNWYRNYYNC